MNEAAPRRIYLGQIYTPLPNGEWRHLSNGALVVDATGRIEAVEEHLGVARDMDTENIVDFGKSLLIPGLVDCHQHLTHYEWVRSVPDLFEWLERIYAIEKSFALAEHAQQVAGAFFADLARNGTTTCCVHGPYFRDATETAFQEAQKAGVRVLMGMNMGDTDLPAELTASLDELLRRADELHDTWSGSGDGLLDYVYTVRPAYCASERLLRSVGDRAQTKHVRVQSHLGESEDGRNRILHHHPGATGEAAVYESFGLLSPQTVMAHGVHTTDGERELLAKHGVNIAHCPRANLLAGGKQMELAKYRTGGTPVGLGTDLGGGKGLSMFRAMEDALKVTPDLSIHDVFRLATLGGAQALGLGERIGSLEVGKDADFLVVRPKCTTAAPDLEDMLSALVFRGDDRDIEQVFVKGRELSSA